MPGPDYRSLKLILRAAKPGRDRLLVLVAIATAGRMPVDDLRKLTVLEAKRRLLFLDGRPFVASVLNDLNDPIRNHDDVLFPSRKRDKEGRPQPMGRAAAWKVVHDAVQESGVAKRLQKKYGSGFTVLDVLMRGEDPGRSGDVS
jgi:hypothetical protein